MESEALRGIRTTRNMKSSVEVAARRKPKTTNSLGKTKEDIRLLESVDDVSTRGLLREERKRFAAREASVQRVRKRLLRFRKKLAVTVNRNRALMDLRHELQRECDTARQEPLVQRTPQMSTRHGWRGEQRERELKY
jgi:hypothetical protein